MYLTQSYLDVVNGIKVNNSIPCNLNNYWEKEGRDVERVIVHYTGNASDTARNNALYFQSYDGGQASAHLFVDDNEIYSSVALKDVACHIGYSSGNHYLNGCSNDNSIGIEMCCSGYYTVSDKTKLNTAYAVAVIFSICGWGYDEVDSRVFRHYDANTNHKECPYQFVKNENEWLNFKNDIKNILGQPHNESQSQPDKKNVDDTVVLLCADTDKRILASADIESDVVGFIPKDQWARVVEEKEITIKMGRVQDYDGNEIGWITYNDTHEVN